MPTRTLSTSSLHALTLAALLTISPIAFAQQQATTQHSKDTITATGEGNSVGIRGRALQLSGHSIKVGDKLPSATLVGENMAPIDLAAGAGKVRVLSIVPSIDTATCEAQTHELSETTRGLDKLVQLVTISMDLPFAQRRFAKEAKISNVTFLSDYRGASFGNNAGLLQKQSQLLARAVLVVDKDNVVRHMQVMPDMSFLPDMEQAFKVAKGLL